MIVDALRQIGIEPKRVSAAEWASPCPGCGGQDRFRSWPGEAEGGRWLCRQCGKTGDLIQFFREFAGMSFKEAALAAGQATKIKPGAGRVAVRPTAAAPASRPTWKPVAHPLPPEKWRVKAGAFVDWCHAQLLASPALLAWLENERGLSRETVERHKLGLNPGRDGQDLYRARSAWGLDKELNDRGRERRLWLPRGLVLPAFDPASGELLRVKIRRWKRSDGLPSDLAPAFEDGPEWARQAPYSEIRGSSEATMRLPATEATARAWVIVESELDGLLVHQEAGDMACVVVLGSASRRPDAPTAEALRTAAVILVALDVGDEPGADPAERQAWNWWIPTFPGAEVWPVPVGKDPGEAWRAGVNLRSWVVAGLPPALAPGAATVATIRPAAGSEGGGAAQTPNTPCRPQEAPRDAFESEDDVSPVQARSAPQTAPERDTEANDAALPPRMYTWRAMKR